MDQLRAQGAVGNRDIVAELIQRSFLARGCAEQKVILQESRQLPKLEIRSRGRLFRQEWYNKKDWVCGSESRQNLFCWPCLLFRPGTSPSCAITGYKIMRGFLSDYQKHEKAKSHMEA